MFEINLKFDKIYGLKFLIWGFGGVLIKVGVILGIVYVIVVGYMYFNQCSFVFVLFGMLVIFVEKGLEGVFVEVIVMVDGIEVIVWQVELIEENVLMVFYFYGNFSMVFGCWKWFKQIFDSGYGFYVLSYCGYVGSEGFLFEVVLIFDVLEYFDWLLEVGGVIILYGESFGIGVVIVVVVQCFGVELFVLEVFYMVLVDIVFE